jgi:hypothetical protein
LALRHLDWPQEEAALVALAVPSSRLANLFLPIRHAGHEKDVIGYSCNRSPVSNRLRVDKFISRGARPQPGQGRVLWNPLRPDVKLACEVKPRLHPDVYGVRANKPSSGARTCHHAQIFR